MFPLALASSWLLCATDLWFGLARTRVLPHKQGMVHILEPSYPSLDRGDGIQQSNVTPNKEINRLVIMSVHIPNRLPLALPPVLIHKDLLPCHELVLPIPFFSIASRHLRIRQHLPQRRNSRPNEQCPPPRHGPGPRDHQPGRGVDRVVQARDAHAGQQHQRAARQDGRVDKVGAQQVDADPLPVAQRAQAAKQARDAVLGGDVLGDAGEEGEAGAGADEEQMPVVTAIVVVGPTLVLLEPKEGEVGRVHGPNQVDLEATQARRRRIGLVQPGRVLEALARDGALPVADAGRDDDGVETARGRQADGLLEELRLGGPIRHVDMDEMVVAGRGQGAQLGDQGGAVGVVDVANDQVGAVRGPVAGEPGAEPRGAAGDEDGFALEGGEVDGGVGVYGDGLVDR